MLNIIHCKIANCINFH